jgi:hypothetical protein
LLLGAGEDELWPSDVMVGRMADRVSQADRSRGAEVHVFPRANHFICGTGTDPVRAGGLERADDAIAANQAALFTRDFGTVGFTKQRIRWTIQLGWKGEETFDLPLRICYLSQNLISDDLCSGIVFNGRDHSNAGFPWILGISVSYRTVV